MESEYGDASDERPVFYPFDPDWAVPPGATLREWAEKRDPEYAQLTELFFDDPERLPGLLAGMRELTPEDALLLAALTGIPMGFWLRMEENFRAGLAAGKKQV